MRAPSCVDGCTQVYKAELRGSGVEVAVKVQRPDALATISKGGVRREAWLLPFVLVEAGAC